MNTEAFDRIVDAPAITRAIASHSITEARHAEARRNAVRETVLGNSRKARLGEIVTLLRTDPDPTVEDAPQDDISADVYVVEVLDPFGDYDSAWTTVINGKTDHQHFIGDNARWIATLHAMSVRFGGEDDHATGAEYAARVLNIPRD